ncbi:MAG: hypothetical protein L3V56_09980 [Candidatus Magnetoovum sp. WYHC-5]|nr:hypothetical protein [Candidatus Magnetoovum sp. WYHC-5]
MSIITLPKVLQEVLGDSGAEALVKVINEADLGARQDLATKEDIAKLREEVLKVEYRLDAKIDRVETKLNERMIVIEGEIKFQRWMLSILLAGVISLIMKAFFIP